MSEKRLKLVAISSGGGHWVQLLRLRPAFEECDVTFLTVNSGYQVDVPGCVLRVIPDANRHQKARLVLSALTILVHFLQVRPDIVLSTGAAPGFLGIWIARRLGIRTVWIDSIANVEELSLSGQAAAKHAHLWLTQWPHLATPNGPAFRGNVL